MSCGIYSIVNKVTGKRYVGKSIKVWETMYSLLIENPDYFRIAIYNCLNGHKKSYRGFVWRKII